MGVGRISGWMLYNVLVTLPLRPDAGTMGQNIFSPSQFKKKKSLNRWGLGKLRQASGYYQMDRKCFQNLLHSKYYKIYIIKHIEAHKP